MPLKSWLLRHYLTQQWLIDRKGSKQHALQGIRQRTLLSRNLCLHFSIDLQKIPASKRQQALQQQLLLLSPFNEPGHYSCWQGGRAQLWIWDQQQLQANHPEQARLALLPDSALSLRHPLHSGERLVRGIAGLEWQCWKNGQLLDSRWYNPTDTVPALDIHEVDLQQTSPLQAADQQRLQVFGIGLLALLLLASLAVQTGAWLDLRQENRHLQKNLEKLQDNNQLQAQAKRRTQHTLELWQQRQQLLQHSQHRMISELAQALPATAGRWQRYSYQPERLQLFLQDATPDPREYVKRLDATGLFKDVQVQPEPRSNMLTLQARPLQAGSQP